MSRRRFTAFVMCFNPRRPRGRRHAAGPYWMQLVVVSIHAAREGGDGLQNLSPASQITFQSTPPARAATETAGPYGGPGTVSIHAAREGGDIHRHNHTCRLDVSIHAAREGGDHHRRYARNRHRQVSIHAAREGGDNSGSDR